MESAPLARFYKVLDSDGSIHIINELNIGNLEFAANPNIAGSAVMETKYQISVPSTGMNAFSRNLYVVDPNSDDINMSSGSVPNTINSRFFQITDTTGGVTIVNETYIANMEIGKPSTPSNYIVLITGSKVIVTPAVMNALLAELYVTDLATQTVSTFNDQVLNRFIKVYDNYGLLHIVNESMIASIEIGATLTSACYIVLEASYKIRTDYNTCQNILSLLDTTII